LGVEVLRRRCDMNALAHFLLDAVKERSIVLLIGDFLEPADLSLLAARHETYAVIVRDPFEEHPQFDEAIELADPTQGRRFLFEADGGSIEAYRKSLADHDRALEAHFLRHRIGFSKIYTSEDPFLKLREMLK